MNAQAELEQKRMQRAEGHAHSAAIEESSFVILESGRIGFYVRPRASVWLPTSLDDVERFSFALAPRNHASIRRITVDNKRLPDEQIREHDRAHVDQVGSAAQVFADLRARGDVNDRVRTGGDAIELVCGTYAIASHRDHAHLLYQLESDPEIVKDAPSLALVTLLRIASRASYVALVFPMNDGALPIAASSLHDAAIGGRRGFVPLEPRSLDHEGTELVLIGGARSTDPAGRARA